jgi:tRNA1(Val) A37 N6-methylase TrmN6
MSKLKGKPTRFSSPYDTTYKTERTAVAVLMHWMREIIKDENLDLGLPDVETSGVDRKFPDTVIYESKSSNKVLSVIEAKPPYYDIFDEKLKKEAWIKAVERKAKYFCVTNFKTLIWYNTQKVNEMRPEEEQIVEKYSLSEIENLDDIEEPRYSEPIKKGLKDFLLKLYSIYSGKEPEPKHAIDEFLIFRLYEKIKTLTKYYKRIIEDQCHKNTNFQTQLKKWFKDQGWSFTWHPQDFDKAARQTAYLLVNKILFYNLLQVKRPHQFNPLEISEKVTKGSLLQKILQAYFNEVLKIDYETIYTTDFIDNIAFPEEKAVVEEIKNLVNILKRYDFSKLGYDVVGRIFERLIPQQERHNLGQYFTNPDVVDLILKFCLHHENDKILDPACGAGTFLVRAYQHKKLMNMRLKHEEILETLWGVDIAKFPAHLATINLAINDLSVDKNYPNILNEDFFDLIVGKEGFEAEKWRKARAKTLGLKEREVIYPRWFDAIVGNPPYTRQEEIGEISPEDEEYKDKLIKKALFLDNKKIAQISKRAGIYAYFFIHGTKFLKDGGYFGFIVSNSWLDVEYGKGLQEFFLKNYKIIAIIESKVERWFEEADVNTCIVILQKCKDKKERDKNLVRFVYLKKPLRHFIPPAQDMWEKQKRRIDEIDKLIKTIFFHNDFYENEELRIFPKKQKELWDEGFDPEEKKYVGAKWGKYLRAPEIFFKILEKGKNKFVQLKDVAEIIGGIITGNNDFFYFKGEKIKKVEEKFLKPVIKSPRELNKIVFTESDIKYKILVCDKSKEELKGTKVLEYIQKAEEKNINKAKTFGNREPWYLLPMKKAKLLWPDLRWEKHICHLNKDNVLFEHLFYGINPKKDSFLYPLCLYLNSTIAFFFIEIIGRTGLGGGAIRLVGTDLATFPCIKLKFISRKKINSIKNFLSSKIGTVFEEIGASTPEEVSLEKVKKERRELDKIIMGEILGLTDEEQLEVYRAVIDLVKSRIEKAKSFGKKKIKEGIDIDALVKTVKEKIGENTLGKFYKEKILSHKPLLVKKLPLLSNKIEIKKELFGWRIYSGRQSIECDSEEEARYLKVFFEAGLEEVKIPKDKNYLKKILPELEKLKIDIDKIINYYLESIVNTKIKKELRYRLWSEIIK